MARSLFFWMRQVVLVTLAVLAYFGVRGFTQGDPLTAHRNASLVLELERRLNLDVELTIQGMIAGSETLLTLANWIYIWGHWPLVIATLVWLAANDRENFYVLRNAMFISGAIGLIMFAAGAVAPPRLFGAEYVDTVTMHSVSYRLLQPPALVNKYAAVPSLHFGWNLLVGAMWARKATSPVTKVAAALMPVAMAIAVVATANHWVADVIVGGAVATTGLMLQPVVRRWLTLGAAIALIAPLLRATPGRRHLDRITEVRFGAGQLARFTHRRKESVWPDRLDRS